MQVRRSSLLNAASDLPLSFPLNRQTVEGPGEEDELVEEFDIAKANLKQEELQVSKPPIYHSEHHT